MKHTTFGKFVSMAAVCLIVATAARAGTAIWQGGATGDIDNTDNWNSGANIAADYLNFSNNVTVTMSADTAVFNPFGNKGNDESCTNKTVVFDMGGHNLWATDTSNGKFYMKGNTGTAYVFTNGVFRCAPQNNFATTNIVERSGTATNMTITAIGGDTTIVAVFNLAYSKDTSLRILNGAKAFGKSFSFGRSAEASGAGSEMCFSGSCYVGPLSTGIKSEAADPPHGSVLLVDGAALNSASPASAGTIYIGYGNNSYDNAIVAKNGARVATKVINVGHGAVSDGVMYSSSNNVFKATGAGTAVWTPPNGTGQGSISCGNSSSGNLFSVEDGASLDVRYITVGSVSTTTAPYYTSSNNTFMATGSGTSVNLGSGNVTCGKGKSADNTFLVNDGAIVTNVYQIFVGTGAATNNLFKVAGSTTLVNHSGSVVIVGGDDADSVDSSINRAIVEESATMTNKFIYVNLHGTGNSMSIRSGAAVYVDQNVCLGGRDMGTPADCGAKGRVEVVGEGTILTCNGTFYIRNGTAAEIANGASDATKSQELLVGDGATFSHTGTDFRMLGNGNKIIVSNGTLEVKALQVNGYTKNSVPYPATNSTFRIEGAGAKLTATATKDVAGNDKQLVGAPIFEFKIPEGGWASAPVAINQTFTIGGDTIIRIDAASARKYAGAGGGTVPLISTGTSGKAITADISKLTAVASLPDGCSLRNEDGVLSVDVKALPGMTIFVR